MADETHLAAESLLEAALLTQNEALSEQVLRHLCFPPLSRDKLIDVLNSLQKRWESRALQLVENKEGWRFKLVEEAFHQLSQIDLPRTPRYSRAVLETLAIIAYQQPVTRSDIEAIRGITVSGAILQTLQDRGWIEIIGQRESLGRPNLWATTSVFLNDLQLKDLKELPPLTELGELILPDLIEPAVSEDTAEELSDKTD